MGILERIKDIENEISRTQKNKATNHHLCRLRAQLCKYRTELLSGSKSGGGNNAERGFEVAKSGDGRVALIGFPSVGKSSLLSALTGTSSEAAAYEFTTLTAIPGNILYNEARIQMLDLPGIIEGAAYGRGRGRQVVAVAKTADLIMIVLDAAKEIEKNHREILERELYLVGIRLNQTPPNVSWKKKKVGGIKFSATCKLTKLGEDPEVAVKAILQEYKHHNCELLIREDITDEQLIDVIEGNRKYVRCMYLYNKVDMISIEEVDEIARRPNTVVCSVMWRLNFDFLLRRIWDMMALVRVYTKKKGEPPSWEPVIVSEDRTGGATVEHLCNAVHRDLLKRFNYALVWGSSCRHSPQRCGLKHVLQDEDVVQIVKKTVGQQARTSDYAQQCQEHFDAYKEKRKQVKGGGNKLKT
jgi:small GTP-binding protein